MAIETVESTRFNSKYTAPLNGDADALSRSINENRRIYQIKMIEIEANALYSVCIGSISAPVNTIRQFDKKEKKRKKTTFKSKNAASVDNDVSARREK